jgi:hypothetical protein
MFTYMLEEPYKTMKIHSAHAIQDMGSYIQCKNFRNDDDERYTEYAMLNLNLSHVPIFLHFG